MPQLVVDVIADWNSEAIQNLGKLLVIKENVTPERITEIFVIHLITVSMADCLADYKYL